MKDISVIEEYLVRLLSRKFIVRRLKYYDFGENDNITGTIELIFNNNEILTIPKVLMVQSKLWRESLFNGMLTGSDITFKINHPITTNGKKALSELLDPSNSTKEFYTYFETIDDMYTFIIIFQHLGLRYHGLDFVDD
jgi:hypothetical protein